MRWPVPKQTKPAYAGFVLCAVSWSWPAVTWQLMAGDLHPAAWQPIAARRKMPLALRVARSAMCELPIAARPIIATVCMSSQRR